MEQDLATFWPPSQQAAFRRCVLQARATRQPAEHRFESVITPGEGRLLVVAPNPNGTVTVLVYAVPLADVQADVPHQTTALSMAGVGMVVASSFEFWWPSLVGWMF
jgi:hypothetical protein